jgi:hypothetical protein
MSRLDDLLAQREKLFEEQAANDKLIASLDEQAAQAAAPTSPRRSPASTLRRTRFTGRPATRSRRC